MTRLWLVEVRGTWFGDVDSYLPHWFSTRAEAERALENYRAAYTVDCPMRVVRFNRVRRKS